MHVKEFSVSPGTRVNKKPLTAFGDTAYGQKDELDLLIMSLYYALRAQDT
jgi:hypothetical protein